MTWYGRILVHHRCLGGAGEEEKKVWRTLYLFRRKQPPPKKKSCNGYLSLQLIVMESNPCWWTCSDLSMADEWQWRFDHRSAKRWLVLVESHSGKTNLKGISSFSDSMLSFSLPQETFSNIWCCTKQRKNWKHVLLQFIFHEQDSFSLTGLLLNTETMKPRETHLP